MDPMMPFSAGRAPQHLSNDLSPLATELYLNQPFHQMANQPVQLPFTGAPGYSSNQIAQVNPNASGILNQTGRSYSNVSGRPFQGNQQVNLAGVTSSGKALN
jgi:hypothetical protein